MSGKISQDERWKITSELCKLADEVPEGALEDMNLFSALVVREQKILGLYGLSDIKSVLERMIALVTPFEPMTQVRNLGSPFDNTVDVLLCEECGYTGYADALGNTWNYCPHCGAKNMTEE